MWSKENLSNLRGISLRELYSYIRHPENPIFRLSKLPKALGGGIRRNPGRVTLALILAMGAAQAINLGKQFMDDQPNIAALTAQVDNTDTGVSSYTSPKLDEIPPRPEDLIRQYMNDHREKFNKFWNVTTTEMVQIRINVKEGINKRDFPDPQIGQIIPGGGLPYDGEKPLPGVFQRFIAVKDPKTEEISIWAVRWNSDSDKPKFETFAVYYKGQWLVNFINEDAANVGGTITGERLFKEANPSLFLPEERPVNGVVI